MLVIENPNARLNAGERAFIAHQRGRDGIALVNFTVGGGGPRKPGREVDVILLLPRGVFSVEVKHTSAKGELDSPLNDVWSIGEVEHPFSSRSKSPAAQADQATKILASHLASPDWPKVYITPVVSLHGPVTIPEKVRWVGTVGVSTVEHFDLVVDQAEGKRIRAEHVGPMLLRLGVARANLPALDDLAAMGFGTDQDPGRPSTQPDEQPAARRSAGTPQSRSIPDAATDRRERRPRSRRNTAPRPDRLTATKQPEVADESPEPRQRFVLFRELSPTRGFQSTAAALVLIVLLAIWQLMAGDFFRAVFSPELDETYFLYGTWTPDHADTAHVVMPPEYALAGLGAGAVLATLGAIGLWLRFKVRSVTAFEMAAYLGSIFLLIAGAPALFAHSGWVAIAWVSLLYTFAWPLAAMVLRDLASPLSRYVEHLRHEYTV